MNFINVGERRERKILYIYISVDVEKVCQGKQESSYQFLSLDWGKNNLVFFWCVVYSFMGEKQEFKYFK